MRAILMPGMDGTGELLAEFAAALAPEFDATIVSYPTDTVLDYDALVERVRDSLPREQPFVLIAESFSGPIAIKLAASNPEGLAGVVLCASFAKSPRPNLPFAGLLRRLPLRKIPAWLSTPWLMGRWSSPDWSRRMQDAIRSVLRQVLRQRLGDAMTVDVTAAVADIRCPLLYLKASCDRIVLPASWEAIRDASRNAICIEIEGPHFLLQAKPRDCAAAIKR